MSSEETNSTSDNLFQSKYMFESNTLKGSRHSKPGTTPLPQPLTSVSQLINLQSNVHVVPDPERHVQNLRHVSMPQVVTDHLYCETETAVSASPSISFNFSFDNVSENSYDHLDHHWSLNDVSSNYWQKKKNNIH